MSTVREDQVTVAETRKLPINDRLRAVLLKAAERAEVDVVRVISGGQPSSGPNRVGSTRHDDGNAADLELLKGERTLDFTKPDERPIVESFVRAAAACGACGIGAGVNYMGPTRLHVGFGTQAVWGEGGEGKNAPEWLKDAAMQGWRDPTDIGIVPPRVNPGDIDKTKVPGRASLAELQEVIRSEESVVGPLFEMRNDGTDTILAYDQSRESPVTPIILEQDLDDNSARDGRDYWVTSGIAMISGSALSISAYRAAFRREASPGGAAVSREVPLEGRALLDTIASTESDGYDLIYNGKKFTDFSRHPNIPVEITTGPNKGKFSTAAGRYQFLIGTWNELQQELNLPDFSPESQDRAAWHLAQKVYRTKEGRDLLSDLQKGQLDQVGPALHGTWTSLPGGIEQGVNHNLFITNFAENLAKQRGSFAGPTTGSTFGSLVTGGFFSADSMDLSVPRSIRTNNPGALNFSDWQSSRPGFVGKTQPDGSVNHNVTSIYRTPEHGIGSWFHLLKVKYGFGAAGSFSIRTLAQRYAGSASGAAVDQYVNSWVALSHGTINPTSVINISNDDELLKLAKAMFHNEAGTATPVHDEQILFAIRNERAGTLPT